jgi:hypothetical protein
MSDLASRNQVLSARRSVAWPALLALLLAWIIMFGFNPATAPPLWFDEGWSLSVARNWVEFGQYGRLLDGQLISSTGMAQPLAATAPVALGFNLLGVGIWQGRVSGAFYTLVALALLYALANQLYDRRVATAALWIAIVLPMHNELNPLFIGRQALAEMPLMVYLLAGYLFLLLAVERIRWLPLAMMFWGLALTTKGHVVPFWLVALLVPLLLALARRQWRIVSLLLAGGAGAVAFSIVFAWLQRYLEGGLALYGAPMIGLYNVTVLVPQLDVRLAAVRIVALFGIPTLLGLLYALWDLKRRRFTLQTGADIVRLCLVVQVSTWLLWYVLLSVNWERYLFPIVFLGSMFVALLLDRLTCHFDLRRSALIIGDSLRQRRGAWTAAQILLAIVLVAGALTFSLIGYMGVYLISRQSPPALAVAEFLNTRTEQQALIETYDSELLFLLNRRYHYPPDQTQVEANRRLFLHEGAPLQYDPLSAADPDYLVSGPFSAQWGLYQAAIASGAFRRVFAVDRYEVYARVR